MIPRSEEEKESWRLSGAGGHSCMALIASALDFYTTNSEVEDLVYAITCQFECHHGIHFEVKRFVFVGIDTTQNYSQENALWKP